MYSFPVCFFILKKKSLVVLHYLLGRCIKLRKLSSTAERRIKSTTVS